MHLVIDSETTGLPRNWNAPKSDGANWPRIVQLAWSLHDDAGGVLESRSFIVRPEGFVIPDDAARVHKISQMKALADGRPLAEVLDAFAASAAKAKVIVAHNLSYDEMVIGAEFVRAARPDPFAKKSQVCTMKVSTDLCAFPGGQKGGFKWPKLPELHAKLFGVPAEEKHEAAHDVAVCARCYFELIRRGIVKLVREKSLFG
jgi:DNA polymerase III epsilon subunit-like protein